MMMLSALISIMTLHIILVLVLLVREENSAIGHTWSGAEGNRFEAAKAA